MFKKTLISEFFTTISFNIFLNTLTLLSYKLPTLRYGKEILLFEEELLSFLGTKKSKIISFYNGRSAIFHCLKIIGIKENDEIIIPGYTCVSVSNSVIQSGGKIIYSDINKDTLGLDIKELQKSITTNTKVIIVQHTFGKPSEIKKIIAIAKENNILVIEDCAHSLGSEIENTNSQSGRKLGTFGNFAIFSTGRDKIISSVTGGFLIINDKKYFSFIKGIKEKLIIPSKKIVLRNLFYNIIGYKAYKTYDFFGLGKVIIFLSRKFHLITEILTKKEKNCNFKKFNYSFPNSLAFLARKELKKIDKYNFNRQNIAHYYDNNFNKINKLFSIKKNEVNIYFRYPILCRNKKEKEKLYKYMKINNIILGNTWSGENIVPTGSNLEKAQYKKGTCPTAEKISQNILTLPNHNLIKIKDVKRVVKLINKLKV